MNLVLFVTSVIIGLLLAETQVARRHDAVLRARGAVEPKGDVYRALALLYPTAFVAMGLEGMWRAAHVPAGPAAEGPSWFASGAVLFVASKALKYWAIRSLGERWTFRVLILPGAPLVCEGPYRYIAHPNYIAVAGELLSTAMMDSAWVLGPIMGTAFGAALAARWRFETRALKAAYGE